MAAKNPKAGVPNYSPNSGNQGGGGGNSSSSDGLVMWIFLPTLLGLFAFMILKILGVIVAFIHGLIGTPIYALGDTMGSAASSITAMVYACIFGLWFLIKFPKEKLNRLKVKGWLLLLALFWVLIAISPSLYTDTITAVCKPKAETNPWLWIMNCEDFKKSFNTSIFTLLWTLFVPNLLFFIPMAWHFFSSTASTMSNPHTQYSREIKLERYISLQKPLYGHLSLYTRLNPLKLPLYQGHARILDNAKRFIFNKDLINNFIEKEPNANAQSLGEQSVENKTDTEVNPLNRYPSLNAFKFEQEMLLQLGEVYTGKLSDLQAIVLGVIAPRILSLDSKVTDEQAKQMLKELYENIDEIWEEVSRIIDFQTGTITGDFRDKFLQKYHKQWDDCKDLPVIQDLINRHAYTNTLIIAAFTAARRLGVLQSSEFSWLKFFDRRLWALVNSIGRPSSFCECLGCFAHYTLEIKAGTRVYSCSWSEAKSNLENILKTYHYTPEVIEAWECWNKTGDISKLADTDFLSENEKTLDEVYENENRLLSLYRQKHGVDFDVSEVENVKNDNEEIAKMQSQEDEAYENGLKAFLDAKKSL